MKKAIFLILVLALCLSLCACGGADTSETKSVEETETAATVEETVPPVEAEDAESAFDAEAIDALLQGTWMYYDSTIDMYDELLFRNGEVQWRNWLGDSPETATTSNATYTLEEGYIHLYFAKTDYHNTFEYSWAGNELVLHQYIDSGYDEGNTRIYQKQDNGQSDSETTEFDTAPVQTEEPPAAVTVTSGMENALRSAESYLSIMPFSYTGLIEQLEYEGYTYAEASYAADYCGADWYEQAVKAAENYLDFMSFSRDGLIDQLEYEGYTYEQAVYGVDQVY